MIGGACARPSPRRQASQRVASERRPSADGSGAARGAIRARRGRRREVENASQRPPQAIYERFR